MTYHLISRLVDREWFIKTSDERKYYLKLLGIATEASDWRLLCYAIMSNHIHIGVVAGDQPLDRWIRRVHSPFADFMNRAYSRIGPIFVRGPNAHPVEPESFPHLLAYIHNNPVRAGLCSNASGSSWTSHRAYIGVAATPRWLHVSEGLSRAGFDDTSAFDAWTDDPARAATDARFTEEHRVNEANAARRRDLLSRHSTGLRTADALVAATAEILGIAADQLRSTARGQLEVLGRLVAVQSADTVGLSGRAIAHALHLSQQHVSELRRRSVPSEMRLLCSEVASRVLARTGTSGV